MPRQSTWGVDPRTGLPKLISAGTGVGHTAVEASDQGLLGRFVPKTGSPSPVVDQVAAPAPSMGDSGGTERPSNSDGLTGGVQPLPRPANGGLLDGIVDVALPGEGWQGKTLNKAIDAVTGLPFGIASTLINPRVVDTSWGTPFNTGGGGIIGAGGELSRRNLESIYKDVVLGEADRLGVNPADVTQHPDFDPAQQGFYGPDTIGSSTPLAASDNILGGRVVSGNTDLAIQQNPGLDVNGDGQLTANELQNAAAAQEQIRMEQARQAEIERLEQERQYAAAEQARVAAEEAERARQEELTRQQRAAEAAARQEAERQAAREAAAEEARQQEAARLAEAQRRANETGRDQSVGTGSPVTDRHGNPVRDSSGGVVTDNRTTVSPDNDDGGGGGGGGTWCCTAAMKQGMSITKVKELRKWHRQQSDIWQNGYDRWGKFIADNLVANSPFWSSVTEEGHNLFVNKKLTAKGALAWLVIAPGSYIAGGIDAIQKRKAKTISLGERTGDSSKVVKQV